MSRQRMWIMFDNLKRQLYVKNELRHLLLKGLLKNSNTTLSTHHFMLFKKSRLVRFSSRVQHRNRCVASGRNWNILHKTKYSRFVFRKEGYEGRIPGLSRAS